MSHSVSRSQENRRQLFEAAVSLFREKGFDDTSADDIAARAGCSRATFFNHFGSKSSVLRYYGQELEARVSAALETRSQKAAPLEELQRILLTMAREAEAQRENLKIILVHSLRDGSYFSHPSPSRMKIISHVAALLSEAQKRGEVRTDLPAPALATQLIGLYNHAIASVLFANQRPAKAISLLWSFVQGGLFSPPARTRKTPKKRKRV